MKPYRISIILSILSIFCINIVAQGVISFTSDNGLSNTCIRSFYEDSRHNVWICTTNGLNRYDGAKIIVYSQDAPEGYAMKSNYATDVEEIDPQTILIGLDSHGMQILDVKTNRFYDVPLINSNGDTIQAYTSCLEKMHDGNILVITAGYGIFELKKSKYLENGVQQYHATFLENLSKYGPMRQILNDSKNRIWLMNQHTVLLLSKNHQLLQTFSTSMTTAPRTLFSWGSSRTAPR